MRSSYHHHGLGAVLLLWGASNLGMVSSTGITPILPTGFFFDWMTGAPRIPITEQCETLNITWQRTAANTGPNPVAPYFLQVYTSTFIQPFIIPAGDTLAFNWAVPFAPGTLFDKFGTSGGCQETYTIIPSSSSPSPTCPNITFVPQLQVTATVDNGPMSQFGFVDQCTDISLTPISGKPPYTLTVAPALHPPYNITSFDMQPINWTVSLNWASPFFISLADSSGSMWSNGPLHAGGGGTIGCLAGNVTSSGPQVKVPVAIGVSFAVLIFGIIVGIVGTFGFLVHTANKKKEGFVELPDAGSPSGVLGRIMQSRTSQRRVDPFRVPMQDDEGQSQAVPGGQVYVVHHDGSAPPVTIFHQEGTRVVELPPSYPAYSTPESEAFSEGRSPTRSPTSSSQSGSSVYEEERREYASRHYDPRGPLTLHQNRQPNLARKPSSTDTT